MRDEPRALTIGRIQLHGEDLELHNEDAHFDVKPGEAVALVLRFDYREAGAEKDEAEIRFSAELGGQKIGAVERGFEDRPMSIDDAKGFVSIPFTAPRDGPAHGRFHLVATYRRSAWDGGEQEEWRLEREGAFTLNVRAKVHHV